MDLEGLPGGDLIAKVCATSGPAARRWPPCSSRSVRRASCGSASTFYAQALAKIERGHAQDRSDVARMRADGLVLPERLRELFEAIVPQLHRYPALDEGSFRRAVALVLGDAPT